MNTFEDKNGDDFLNKMMMHVELESPSEGFVERVMAGLEVGPEAEPAKKPFFAMLNSVWPFFILLLVVLMVLFTSDLPFLNWLPGKDNLLNVIQPYINLITSSMSSVFKSSYGSFGLLIGVSAGLLFLVDRFLIQNLYTRRKAA